MLQNPAYRLIYPDTLNSLLRRLRKRLLAYIVITATGLTSCTTGRTGLPTTKEPGTDTQSSVNRISRVSGSTWRFDFDHDAHTYTSTTHVSLQTVNAAKLESDTITSTIHFTITADRTHVPIAISGVVDRVRITTGNRIGRDTSRLEVPFSFEGLLSKQRVELNLAHLATVSPVCANPISVLLGDIRTLLTTLPEELAPTSKWTDTVSTTICNTSGITSAVHTLRSYSVLGDTIYSGLQALVIRRTESTKFEGRGAQGQHEISLTGAGTGSTIIYLDKRGIPLAIDTLEDSQVTVTASGQLKHFNQHLQQTIKLLD